MPKYLSISLSVAIVLIFACILFQNALNAPSFDDYDTTVNFIRRFYFQYSDAATRLKVLVSRQNEHRILISKSIAAAYYGLFGKLDFRSLALIQNLFLPAFFVLVLRVMQWKKLLFPETVLWSAIFLFSLAFWQDTFYYWGGIQHYTVCFFSVLTLFSLDRAQHAAGIHFGLALLAGFLAVASFGNGIIAALLGIFVLAARRKSGLTIWWSLFSVFLIWFAFFPRPDTTGESAVPFNAGWMARLLLTFLGSFVYVNPPVGQQINILLCMAVGAAVLGYWLWLLAKGFAFREPLLYALLSFPILTGIIIAVSRFESKAAGGIAPRYMFFTAFIPVVLVLILIRRDVLEKRHLRWLAGAGLVLWGLVFYNNHRELVRTNAEIVTTLQRWEADHHTPLIYYKPSEEYSEILEWALAEKVVSIPSRQAINNKTP